MCISEQGDESTYTQKSSLQKNLYSVGHYTRPPRAQGADGAMSVRVHGYLSVLAFRLAAWPSSSVHSRTDQYSVSKQFRPRGIQKAVSEGVGDARPRVCPVERLGAGAGGRRSRAVNKTRRFDF